MLDEERVRQYIMAQLAWRMGSTAQAIAKGFVEEMPEPQGDVRGGLAPVQGDRRGACTPRAWSTPRRTTNDLFLLLRN